MIKDVFKLKKDSWHLKLMNFIWGYNERDFPNMCPYFWLSVLNCIIVIIIGIPYLLYKLSKILLGKPLMAVIDWLFKSINTTDKKVQVYCDTKRDDWYNNYIKRLESGDASAFAGLSKSKIRQKLEAYDWKLLYAIRNGHNQLFFSLEKEDLAVKLHKLYLEWEIKQRDLRAAREKIERKKWDIKQQREQEARERRQAIAKMTIKLQFIFKILAYIVGTVAVGFALFLVYNLILLMGTLPWGPILFHVMLFMIVTAAVLTFGVIVYLLLELIKFINKE